MEMKHVDPLPLMEQVVTNGSHRRGNTNETSALIIIRIISAAGGQIVDSTIATLHLTYDSTPTRAAYLPRVHGAGAEVEVAK